MSSKMDKYLDDLNTAQAKEQAEREARIAAAEAAEEEVEEVSAQPESDAEEEDEPKVVIPVQATSPPKAAFEAFRDTRETAEIFQVTPESIRNWIKDGKFPNVRRIGRKMIIPERDIQALLNGTYGDDVR